MRVEKKTKLVIYKVYIAKDGKEFNSRKECEHHEKILDGTRIVCPHCNGEGKVWTEVEYEDYHTGLPETSTFQVTCDKCNGRGYLEKKIKVTWE